MVCQEQSQAIATVNEATRVPALLGWRSKWGTVTKKGGAVGKNSVERKKGCCCKQGASAGPLEALLG